MSESKTYEAMREYVNPDHRLALKRKIKFVNNLYFADNGCWMWQGMKTLGYGRIGTVGGNLLAHRVSYSWVHGLPDPGLVLDHLCNTPCCVNPDHLKETTHADNLLREGSNAPARVNALKTHCPQGHRYSAENTRIKRDPGGGERRVCRACALEKDREYAKKRRRQRVG